ncbi:MAG: sigma-70 family RNA polymerase sigma factor [Siphonobacter sp.]
MQTVVFQPENRCGTFNALVKVYERKLHYHIRRYVRDPEDARDVTQDALLKIWQGLPTFRGDSQLFSWMYRIATHEALNFLRKQKHQMTVPGDLELMESRSALADVDTTWSGDDITYWLTQAIDALPEKQRTVFRLRYLGELPYEEIATQTGTSVGALKANYHLAVQKVEKYILGRRNDF